MSDLCDMLALWRKAKPNDDPFVLATLVAVEGSSYRRPGARMLVTAHGERAGTISGGCLEAEVAKKAPWLVRNGPVVETFKTSFDLDDEVPTGSGCGGTVHLLLETRETAHILLEEMNRAWTRRSDLGVATLLRGPDAGRRGFAARGDSPNSNDLSGSGDLGALAASAFDRRASKISSSDVGEMFVEYAPPRRGIFIFGAGDDAQPMVAYASALGWYVVVIDGRSNLVRKDRFPLADELRYLTDISVHGIDIKPQDAVVFMTHSYEQDLQGLRRVLPVRPTYVGMLGPRFRSERLVRHVAGELNLDYETTMAGIHAPLGMEVGRDCASVIALGTIAQIQKLYYDAVQASLAG